MKGVVLHEGKRYFMDLLEIIKAINNKNLDYNWFITDTECYPENDDIDTIFLKKYNWMSGRQLQAILNVENFKWEWAVLSAFKKDVELKEILEYEFPCADVYPGFWDNGISLQHPLADIEIIPWNGSATFVISKDDAIVDEFIEYFPECEDLESYNKRL
ncbi:Protein of unknown function [Acetitomaculum ruminis DSM 5522]|uniref:Uncharacterized protein n=1 Tax=Acetitomaculum ruminis DSM 5522 TaxID=1120918 RepID=A0A1I0ZV69_9FIRM|nr:DUF2691 family protein [Acetitomaculum ruminis]SFB28113.1 Protein of unknown function [Acetitomaculum ruminis DSM 5522]